MNTIQTVTPDILQNVWNEFNYRVDFYWASGEDTLNTCYVDVQKKNLYYNTGGSKLAQTNFDQ